MNGLIVIGLWGKEWKKPKDQVSLKKFHIEAHQDIQRPRAEVVATWPTVTKDQGSNLDVKLF